MSVTSQGSFARMHRQIYWKAWNFWVHEKLTESKMLVLVYRVIRLRRTRKITRFTNAQIIKEYFFRLNYWRLLFKLWTWFPIKNITSRNNALISNFRGSFRYKSEYPWCIIQVKSKHFPSVFKKIGKIKKKVTEKREFLRKTNFQLNRYFYMVVIQKFITFKFLRNLSKSRKFATNFEIEKSQNLLCTY
ncbi:hypothetical protein AGLY_007834 [Aphis glycines]|uniref:Uncharacterized protein n=1 Tax=Aphis glycines TaxID=307491 RepID=A0A6G0TPE1_APHGL|nr:hypothetical protein AGLY_007834 [Aphis glycines]